MERFAIGASEWRSDEILNDGQRETGGFSGSGLGKPD